MQGGNPVRITRSLVLFNNNPLVEPGIDGFFADPTPRDNSEYLRYTSDRANVEGGQLNVGRVFREATGDAADRIDLLTIATHEIGHALGLDFAYSGFITQGSSRLVVVTPPRPFAGISLLISNGPHLDGFEHTPLMVGKPDPGTRQLISAADALLISPAQFIRSAEPGGAASEYRGGGPGPRLNASNPSGARGRAAHPPSN